MWSSRSCLSGGLQGQGETGQCKQEETEEGERSHRGGQGRRRGAEQPKRVAVPNAVRVVEGAADDYADGDAGDAIPVPLEEDKGKAEQNGDVSDEDDDGGDGEIDWQNLFDRARDDVTVVTAMMREATAGGFTLQVGAICVPDSKLAAEAAGKVLWDDEEKLKRCLASMPGDDGSAVEKWGALLKWWRVVERSFSVTGLFSHLRGMRKGKKTLRERYAVLVKRLKMDGKVLSFKQAEV